MIFFGGQWMQMTV